ncbi:MAG TPA: hypothetical protein VMH20_05035 [Verrucomicrobiae bacterium]|jgi:hypothetical protein|nr:hypothetical protein [Verrucomicrobiae bacterium]
MCPACLAAISMIVAGVVSTGGAAALAVKAMGRKKENGEASGDEAAMEQVEETKRKEKEKQA